MSERVVHLTITGVVQGVGYRAWMCAEARRLGLYGWVRNRVDGSVQAMVAGDSGQVDRIVERAGKGPPHARVDGVVVSAAEGRFESFEQRTTA